ncbi:hypothetical protein FKP32DRAFT_1554661, partial [Trametes sanguinea]
MLRMALDYKTALDTLCSRREHGLRAFELTSEEWGIAQELCETLKDATLFFSRDTPNLAMARVIPAMDHIDTYLTNCTRAPISSSLRTAKKTLNRYYKLSDMSATYRIAMVMHPSHKMNYFERAGWPSAWLKTARELVREEFDTEY